MNKILRSQEIVHDKFIFEKLDFFKIDNRRNVF